MLEDEGVRRFIDCGPNPVLIRLVTQVARDVGIDTIETSSATNLEEVVQLRGEPLPT
jgi:malonyl CoA-acyl carrier protein transacylase